MAKHHGVVIKAAARERQGVAIIEHDEGIGWIGQAALHDLGAFGVPGFGKRKVVLVEGLVRSLDGDIKRWVTANRKRQRHRPRIGNRERLRERRLAHKGIGHVKTESIRILLARLRRIAQLKRHRRSVRRHIDHAMLVITRHTVLLLMARPLLGAIASAITDIAHDGKQDGRGATPPTLIALPEIFAIIKTHAQKLCAHSVDLSRTGIVFNRDDCHSHPFARSLFGFNLTDDVVLEERVLGKDQVVRVGVIVPS